ncbi:MAG: hypothetical protein R3D58_12920 [Saprospiraceae bacterium]
MLCLSSKQPCPTGLMPKRSFSSVEDFETYFAQHDTLLVDGTEQQIQRSKDNSVQKAHYNGKKVTPLRCL